MFGKKGNLALSTLLGKAMCIAAFGLSASATAQLNVEIYSEEDGEIVEMIIVGSRAAPRSAPDSMVAVDAIQGDGLAAQAPTALGDLLRSTVPSFHMNVSPSRDAAALLQPVNLRGLAPDHTLVLVNNKRRHRGAVIQWISNGASDGAQGPDISAIPVAAIERVEVLRDGAAAQYGSDAIAGVLNFLLKDAAEGGSLETKWGFYTEDSSEDMLTVSGNIGLPMTDRGFLNLSAEYNQSSDTDRSVQHPDAAAVAAAGVANVANPAKPWGNPEVSDAVKLFANFGVEVNDSTELYAFGNYTTREVETAFFYRPPQGRTGVYVSGGKMLIGGGPACKAKYDFDATAANVPVVRDMLGADPDCFAFHEILPEGFTPSFGGEMTDFSAVAGLRGIFANGLSYDLSASRGRNKIDYFLDQSVNASYGPDTPRSFDIGAYAQTETNIHVDVSYPIDVGLASDLNIAGGFEWREEEFKISTGEEASWATGPYGVDGFSARSNGFGGFNPASSGTWDRANIAFYVDMETGLTERWRLNGALRWEDFDLFGSVTNFKLASRLEVTDNFALRGSVSTGFRAPTPGQQNANNLATVVDPATGQFREQGTVASNNPVVLALVEQDPALMGGVLDAEKSNNYTLGFVLQSGRGLSLMVDFYRIEVDDRIALSNQQDVTDEIRQILLAGGVSAALDFNRVRWFANDFDSRTQGVEAVMTYAFDSTAGSTNLLASFNYTSNKVTKFNQSLASTAGRLRSLEKGAPQSRFILSATHGWQDWVFMARYNYYGEWFDSDDGQMEEGYGLLDLSVQYNFNENFRVALGADNVLDNYPDEAARSPSSGRLYPRYSPAGYSGRAVYARLRYTF